MKQSTGLFSMADKLKNIKISPSPAATQIAAKMDMPQIGLLKPEYTGEQDGFSFALRTLTPVFTGNVKGNQSDTLRETGLIGSLRFWMAAVARGLGYMIPRSKEVEVETELM